MDPSTLAVSLGMLGLGFVSGFSVGTVLSDYTTEKLQYALRKTIAAKLEIEKRFDDLSEEYMKMVDKYEALRSSTRQFIASLSGIQILPPPEQNLERQEGYVDDESESDISIPETPNEKKDKKD